MRSRDGGESWQDHRPGAQPDVHSLAWHPRARGRAYEAGGGGAASSVDGGESWQPADEGRDRNYTWSVTVDPDDPDCWYVSASTGPYAAHGGRDPQARIYRRRDHEPWQPLAGGLPEPLPAMPYALVAAQSRLFAGLANGELWDSRDRGESWSRSSSEAANSMPSLPSPSRRSDLFSRSRHEEYWLYYAAHGALAQLGERRLCKPEVTGSIPVRSISESPGDRAFLLSSWWEGGMTASDSASESGRATASLRARLDPLSEVLPLDLRFDRVKLRRHSAASGTSSMNTSRRSGVSVEIPRSRSTPTGPRVGKRQARWSG